MKAVAREMRPPLGGFMCRHFRRVLQRTVVGEVGIIPAARSFSCRAWRMPMAAASRQIIASAFAAISAQRIMSSLPRSIARNYAGWRHCSRTYGLQPSHYSDAPPSIATSAPVM